MDISIAEAHNHLSGLLRRLGEGPIRITRHGVAVGVLISPEEYERLSQVRAYLSMVDVSHSLRESGLSAQELYRTSRDELESGQ